MWWYSSSRLQQLLDQDIMLSAERGYPVTAYPGPLLVFKWDVQNSTRMNKVQHADQYSLQIALYRTKYAMRA